MGVEGLAIIGAGGFAREVVDLVDTVNACRRGPNLNIVGFVDNHLTDANATRMARCGIKFLGGDDDFLTTGGADRFVIGIGDPRTKQRLARLYESAGIAPIALIHPKAVVSSRVSIGSGSVICAGSAVSINVSLGRHVHVNPNATIGHDALIFDYVSVNPGAIISGNVVIKQSSLLGAGSVVLEELTIGEGCLVGASACVTRDVLDGVVVKGIPARPVSHDGIGASK